MDSGPCWDRVARALEPDFDLIAYDARSHGLSDFSEEWGDGGADMIGVVEALSLERPAAVGHSMGAAAAASAIASRPELFRAAVLEDPPFMPPARGEGDWEARARMHQRFLAMLEGTTEEIAARGRIQNPKWHTDEFDAWAESKTRFRPPESWTQRFTQQRPPWQDYVRRFQCPVLLVCGGNAQRGRIVSRETAKEAQALSPVLEVVTFDDAGHNIRREAYDGYVDTVRAFLLKNS
jgi:pimeloyl-ACP methyl ester carboxylesterase